MKDRIVTMGLCAIALGAIASSGGSVGTKFECFLGEDRKVEIKISDLPTSVSKVLAENYAGAEVRKAFKWLDDAGAIIGYEVVIRTESGEQTVKFGPNGEPEK